MRNNDPESYLKTAAYFDNAGEERFVQGRPALIRGERWSAGLGSIGPNTGSARRLTMRLLLPDDAPGSPGTRLAGSRAFLNSADGMDPGLPDGVLPRSVHGFTAEGRPREWQ